MAGEAGRADFGALPDGRAVEAITLRSGALMARVLTYGAILQALEMPDRDGAVADIVLGHATLAGYIDHPNYFGATVGRYGNRIARGRFELDGQAYQLALNDGANTLHGGAAGFDKRLWSVRDVTADSVMLTYVSADGEEGYPGTLDVSATYTLGEDRLTIEYRATTDRPTIVNITNHSYFNLAGEGAGRSVLDHRLTIPADATVPVDAGLIPTGELRPVAGTAFDFRAPTPIGARLRDSRDPQIAIGHGYDEHFVVGEPTTEPRLVARVEEPDSGRVLEMLSNQGGVQFYSGNFLDGTVAGKSGLFHRQGDALVLEPQVAPDSPNQPALGTARLDPGESYRNVIVYRLYAGGLGPIVADS